jgi:peptidoglycan/LPS O-acetylase OafA/YrhL
MNSAKQNYRINNFDIIRLLAALQVAFHHAISQMNVITILKEENKLALLWFIEAIELIPGVPVFFFLSGFLISRSFENNSKIGEYTLNRILRIYPGLTVCVVLSILSVWISGYLYNVATNIWKLLIWFFAQITVVQFYNPDFMRGYGIGVINGSLWSICVELQFYVLIPLIYKILNLKKVGGLNKKLLILTGIFLIFNRIYFYFELEYYQNTLYKFIGVSFIPWFYMFLVGVLFQCNFDIIERYLAGKFVLISTVYYTGSIVWKYYFGLPIFNGMSPILFLPLSCLILSFAFTWRNMSNKFLRNNDISYGMYIYHMPIINFLIYMGYSGKFRHVFLAIAIVFIFASFSWLIIEKPFLKLKIKPFNPI